MTVLAVIQRSMDFLSRKGVDSARLQAELLLAHVLNLPRMQLYLNFERTLTERELASFRELIRRRGQREPLQQIMGSTSFCGLELAVNRHVLVPRAETELLAELGWQFLKERSQPNPPGARAASSAAAAESAAAFDFGTGSGCLAIALAFHCPRATIHAMDISTEALDLARQNAARHQLGERIHFLLGDNIGRLPPDLTFDLVISNPPYIPSGEIDQLEPEVRNFEPRQALDGGPDGLDHFRCLAAASGPRLHPGGRLMVEFGDSQEARVADIFERQKWIVETIVEDYTHRPRILLAHRGGLP